MLFNVLVSTSRGKLGLQYRMKLTKASEMLSLLTSLGGKALSDGRGGAGGALPWRELPKRWRFMVAEASLPAEDGLICGD